MGVVYHGSKEHGLKRLEPRKSTHGTYVYATPEKVLALHFSGRAGDDLTYDLGHFSDREGPWELIENIPGAFDKMYSNDSSIYSFPDDTFEDKHTGFREVLSEVGVDVVDEEYCPSVYEGIMEAERQGLLKIYRYPNKPPMFKPDGSDIIDKWRWMVSSMGHQFTPHSFERLFYLRPNLLTQINDLAKELGVDVHFEPSDYIRLFEYRIKRQLEDPEVEQFVESAYQMAIEALPESKEQLDPLFEDYKKAIGETKEK